MVGCKNLRTGASSCELNQIVCFQCVTGLTSRSPVAASTPGTSLSTAGAVLSVTCASRTPACHSTKSLLLWSFTTADENGERTVLPASPAGPVNITSNHEQNP